MKLGLRGERRSLVAEDDAALQEDSNVTETAVGISGNVRTDAGLELPALALAEEASSSEY